MTRRRSGAVAVVAALVAVTLTACSAPTLDHGTVTGKDHKAAGCQYAPILVGKTVVPVQQCWEESWTLRLRDGDTDGKADVDRNTYDHTTIGQTYQKDHTQ